MNRNNKGESVRIHGEAGDVNPEEIKEKIQEIKKNLRGACSLACIQLYETGLQFRLIPSTTFTTPNEQWPHVLGIKAQNAKDCVTLITCTNATCTHKIPLAMQPFLAVFDPAHPSCCTTLSKMLGMIMY